MKDCMGWRTPDWLFDELDEEFNFGADLCASKENTKCEYWSDDYLNFDISEIEYNIQVAYINPPYSNPKPFIEKAWEDSRYCKIVCLVKCDPSTRWWATFWNYVEGNYCPVCGHEIEVWDDRWQCKKNSRHQAKSWPAPHYHAGPKPGCEVRFFPKRIQFDPPIELVNSGKVWKEGKSWFKRCSCLLCEDGLDMSCYRCNGKGYTKLSGPSFSCALVIMDRRGL